MRIYSHVWAEALFIYCFGFYQKKGAATLGEYSLYCLGGSSAHFLYCFCIVNATLTKYPAVLHFDQAKNQKQLLVVCIHFFVWAEALPIFCQSVVAAPLFGIRRRWLHLSSAAAPLLRVG